MALNFADAHPVVLSWLAHVYGVMGERHKALMMVDRARALESSRYVPPFHLALAYVGLGRIDEAFAALDQAWLDRDPSFCWMDADPRFTPLKSDVATPSCWRGCEFRIRTFRPESRDA